MEDVKRAGLASMQIRDRFPVEEVDGNLFGGFDVVGCDCEVMCSCRIVHFLQFNLFQPILCPLHYYVR